MEKGRIYARTRTITLSGALAGYKGRVRVWVKEGYNAEKAYLQMK